MAEQSGFEPERGYYTPTGGLANRCLTRLGLLLHTKMAEKEGLETSHDITAATTGFQDRPLAFRVTSPKWRRGHVPTVRGLLTRFVSSEACLPIPAPLHETLAELGGFEPPRGFDTPTNCLANNFLT